MNGSLERGKARPCEDQNPLAANRKQPGRGGSEKKVNLKKFNPGEALD